MIAPTDAILTDGHGSISPTYLVIHDTEEVGHTAQDLHDYWADSPDMLYVVHYVVDWQGVFFHCVEDNRRAWHCGDGNAVSIGLEICVPDDSSHYDAAWDFAVQAARYILDAHGWNTSHMVSHKWVSEHYDGCDGHTDPIAFLEMIGGNWEEFVSAVANYSDDVAALA